MHEKEGPMRIYQSLYDVYKYAVRDSFFFRFLSVGELGIVVLCCTCKFLASWEQSSGCIWCCLLKRKILYFFLPCSMVYVLFQIFYIYFIAKIKKKFRIN